MWQQPNVWREGTPPPPAWEGGYMAPNMELNYGAGETGGGGGRRSVTQQVAGMLIASYGRVCQTGSCTCHHHLQPATMYGETAFGGQPSAYGAFREEPPSMAHVYGQPQVEPWRWPQLIAFSLVASVCVEQLLNTFSIPSFNNQPMQEVER